MASIPRILMKQFRNRANFIWAFPLSIAGGWILFPALDEEWTISVGLSSDPEAGINKVQAAKDAREGAFKKLSGTPEVEKEEQEEEEEPELEEEDTPSDDEDTDASAGDENEEENAEEEEEEGEEEIKIKPLYMPTKGEHLSPQDIWDNFTSKAVKMNEEDDDGKMLYLCSRAVS